MAAPGTVLAHESLVLDQRVDARDRDGFWYPAKVLKATQSTLAVFQYALRIEVGFTGYPSSHNRKYLPGDAAIREPLSKKALAAERAAKIEADRYQGRTTGKVADGVYNVDKVISKKKKLKKNLYLVRWEGWSSDFDTWEPRSAALSWFIEDFEARAAKVAKQGLREPKPPPVPFSAELVADETKEIVEVRVDDAIELLADATRDAATAVQRAKTAVSDRKLYVKRPMTAGGYHGLREQLARAAFRSQPGRDVAAAVTEIGKQRGGKNPVDSFAIWADDVVNDVMGEAVLSWRSTTNGAAIKLVPPLQFLLKGKINPATQLIMPVKELTIKGHLVALDRNDALPSVPIFNVDTAHYEYSAADITNYQLAMATELLRANSQGTMTDANFSAWAQQVVARGV